MDRLPRARGSPSEVRGLFLLTKKGTTSIWLLILIIVLVVLALGGFGYSRR
jgi:hypothetical protein